jgi:hypothetical protein
MRDGDPHKSVPTSEMFERITTILELIALELHRMPDTTSEIITLRGRVAELRDIMNKSGK